MARSTTSSRPRSAGCGPRVSRRPRDPTLPVGLRHSSSVPEDKMPGGFVNEVVRDGDTVRRNPSPNAAFVHALLELFAQHNWTGAPRLFGVDSAGREILSFVPGYAAWEPDQPAEVRCDESLAAVAALVRHFHDLTAGSTLAGTEQVVCHNDLSPKNTIYRDLGHGLRPIAFVDWDLAAPG